MPPKYILDRTEAFERWIASQRDVKVRIAVTARLDRLAEGSWGDSKPVGDGVTELRIHLGSGWRVYVTERDGRIIVVLGGGTKRRQDADIAAAKAIAREID